MLDIIAAGEGTEAVKEAIWELNGYRNHRAADAIVVVSAWVKGRQVIEKENIRAGFQFDGTNYATIYIYWEEYGHENYRDMGLYGSVKTQYNIVKKAGPRSLAIHDPNYQITIEF